MTIQEAANLARSSAPGSYNYQTALGVLHQGYIKSVGHDPMLDRPNTPGASYLDPLWSWVNKQLQS